MSTCFQWLHVSSRLFISIFLSLDFHAMFFLLFSLFFSFPLLFFLYFIPSFVFLLGFFFSFLFFSSFPLFSRLFDFTVTVESYEDCLHIITPHESDRAYFMKINTKIRKQFFLGFSNKGARLIVFLKRKITKQNRNDKIQT